MSLRTEKHARVVEDEHQVLVCDRCGTAVVIDPTRFTQRGAMGWFALRPIEGTGVSEHYVRHFCSHCAEVLTK